MMTMMLMILMMMMTMNLLFILVSDFFRFLCFLCFVLVFFFCFFSFFFCCFLFANYFLSGPQQFCNIRPKGNFLLFLPDFSSSSNNNKQQQKIYNFQLKKIFFVCFHIPQQSLSQFFFVFLFRNVPLLSEKRTDDCAQNRMELVLIDQQNMDRWWYNCSCC